MDRLYEICDEMASTEQFVTLRSIMEKFHGKSLSKLEGDKEGVNISFETGLYHLVTK